LLLAHIAFVLANESELHASYTLVLSNKSELLSVAALFSGLAGLLPNGGEVFADIAHVLAAVSVVRWFARITAIHTGIAAVLAGLAQVLPDLSAVLAQLAAALSIEPVQSHWIDLLGDESKVLAQHVHLLAEQHQVLPHLANVHADGP